MTWTSVSFSDGEVLTHTKLNTLVSDISNVLNGGITSDNIAGASGIAATQLVNPDFIFVLHLEWTGADVASTAAGNRVDFVSVPPYTFTVDQIRWQCSDVGNQAATFSLRFGRFTAGAWATSSDVINASSITTGSGADTGTGAVLNSGVVVNGSSTTPFAIALEITAVGANYLSTAKDKFSVDLICRRNIV